MTTPEPEMAVKRLTFLKCAFRHVHTPYIWGGKTPDRGLDCSGLVTLSYYEAGGPDWRETKNSDTFWNGLEPVEEGLLVPGDLVFYGGTGPNDVDHVAIWVNNLGLILEASGGDHTTLSIAEAMRRHAEVRVSYFGDRKDLRGFRRLVLG